MSYCLPYPECLQEVTEDLDPSLKPILLQNTFVKGGHTLIKIGDTEIEYNSNFRFVKFNYSISSNTVITAVTTDGLMQWQMTAWCSDNWRPHDGLMQTLIESGIHKGLGWTQPSSSFIRCLQKASATMSALCTWWQILHWCEWSRAGAGLEQGWSRTGAGLEQGWSRAGAGLEQGWSRAGAGLEQSWSRAGAGLEQGWSRARAGLEQGRRSCRCSLSLPL